MAPTLQPGTILAGTRWYPPPKVGHVVVVKRDKPYIKRVTKISKQGYWIEGDNPQASTDSRHFGWIKKRDIEAVVVLRIM